MFENTSTGSAEDLIPGATYNDSVEGTEFNTATGETPQDREMDLNELAAVMEPLEPVDLERMEERLAYAPSLTPGKAYNFIFRLPSGDTKPAEPRTIKGKVYPQFNYELEQVRDDGSLGKRINYLNATTFRSGKMESSRLDDLLFALGKLKQFQQSARGFNDIMNCLSEAAQEQVTVRGIVEWRKYDKEAGITYSTRPASPYKKADGTEVVEYEWPKNADGSFNPRPDQFEGHNGSETVTRVMPTKETQESQKAS